MANSSGIISKIKAGIFLIIFWLVYLLVQIARILLIPISRSHIHLSSEKSKILYLATFFPNNAGYHYRVKLWADELKKEGYTVTIKNVYSERQFHALRNGSLPHVLFYTRGMLLRFVHIFQSIFYHRVIVRREILHFNDYGKLFFEKLLLSIHPNAILDFDDDIAEAKGEPKKISIFGNLLMEHPKKFTASVQMFHFFMVGSHYLKEYVMRINPWIKAHQIVVIPTCVDYDKYPAKAYQTATQEINLGWIGSNNNQQYLNLIEDDIEQLGKRHKITLHIISGKPFETTKDIKIINHAWSIESEIESLMKIDIGLMPLKDSKLQKGKCGFKLVQYMGLGIVGVASSVGANKEIIKQGSNGYLVEPEKSWLETLEKMVSNPSNLANMGAKARQTVLARYSINGNKKAYLRFIQTLHANES